MNMNKKIVTSLSAIALLALPVIASAILIPAEPGVTSVSITTFITNAFANVIWPIFFAIILIYVLIIGFLFLSAQGDPSKVATARQALLWGVIGLVVFALAYSLLSIVKTTFSV